MQVLSEMLKKLKYNPKDKFVCLVVERPGGGGIQGVVEVSYVDEREVLQCLEPNIPGVVYIASMAVNPSVRRQGAAQALLEGAVEVTREWRENKCVLHVYQSNKPAILLYEKRGFKTVYEDSPLWAKVGVQPRFLMQKSI
jgi:ribosomal protein S18 acetylase RimI-like enzyme